ncbi:MAG: segregation/condensation protein A [Lachnospiraceae bacterium]|nr:segregation/condensation protein A [Lachnospiraceae bacterium]
MEQEKEDRKYGIPVKLEVFEGPLDLLLNLIEKNKVNIYDIPIVEITEQYLEYVNQMEKQDLDIVSEFLVMAATLIDIKTKMLLPKKVNEEGKEEDPREELVNQLLEYKKFRYIANELKGKQIEAQKSMFKPPTIPKEVEKYEEPVDIHALLADVTLMKLKSIFEEVMKRQREKVDPIRSKFGKIEKDEVSLVERISDIKKYALQYKKFSFRVLLERQNSKMNVIVTFLAVLELIKGSVIRVEQEYIFDDILIYAI